MQLSRKLFLSYVIGLAVLTCGLCVAQSGPSLTAGVAQTLLPDGHILLTGGLDSSAVPSGRVAVINADGSITVLGSTLHYARVAHTATVLPDGTVLIFGGMGPDGNLVSQMELFDPKTQLLQDIESLLVPRAFHTATVLTSGDLLVAGGVTQGGAYPSALQIWNFESQKAITIAAQLQFPRQGHTAALLANGDVLISGGKDPLGKPIQSQEAFDPGSGSVIQVNPQPAADPNIAIQVAASIPFDGASNVSITQLLAFRFTRLANVETIDSGNITLQDSSGANVASGVGPAESGRIGFLLPSSSLLPGMDYTVTISGVSDLAENVLPSTTIHFHTQEDVTDSSGELWIPGSAALNGNWNSQTGGSQWQKLPALQAPTGITAVSGQVLRINGLPLAHVSLSIGGKKVQSDSTGRFLLTNLGAGHQVLLIDGQTANRANATYGLFEVAVVVAAGKTNVLNYTIWMTKLDTEHAVRIPSPTTAADTVITNPLLPGLELHIPANTVIVDHEGKPVGTISITPVPLDKPPFPLPPGLPVPIYFTVQPGGAYVDVLSSSGTASVAKGARLIYPNTYHEPSGTTYQFWNYDADSKGWYVYGQGSVNSSGTGIVPDPGVVVYEFTGAMVGSPTMAPGTGPTQGCNKCDGDPVDLSTGLFIYRKTDMVLPDTIPLELTRTYRNNDTQVRPFGVGATHNYDIFMVGDDVTYTYQELIMPDGSRIRFNRTSPGTGWGNAVYTHTAASDPFYGAVLSWVNVTIGWKLVMKDGTTLIFPEAAGQLSQDAQALRKITDRYGNTVQINRDSLNRITQVLSPNGRYINFVYDSLNRITSATDNIGRQVLYTYDSNGNLQTVTDLNRNVTHFTYNSLNQMTSVTDPRNASIFHVQNQYDANGRVTKQIMADGGVYQFAWTASTNASQLWGSICTECSGGTGSANRYSSTDSEGYSGLIAAVDITDPRGYVRHVQFNGLGYSSSDTYAVGQPEQQAETYQYYADNLPKSVTDQLGRTASYDYDASGNLTTLTRLSGTPNALTSNFTYTLKYSELSMAIDPLGHKTTIGYDQLGNPTSVANDLGTVAAMSFNGNGQPESVSDTVDPPVKFGYLGGDLVNITDPLGNVTNRYVDQGGRVQSVQDAQGHRTSYQHDNLNHVTQVTDALGGNTTFTYDADSNLLSVTDALTHSTSYTYDNLDRLLTRADPLQRQEIYMYDLGGNIASFTDRKLQVRSYSYDGLNRPSSAAFGVTGSGGTSQSSTSYIYDAGDRLLQATDSASGVITRSYDLLDRLTNETTPQGGISYGYDDAGRRMTMQVSGQSQLGYTWDSANRLTGITQGPSSLSFAYDAANRRSTLTLPNGVVATYSYDGESNLAGISYALGGNVIGNLTYAYDTLGNRVGMGGTLAGTGLPPAVASATYDAANELTNWNGTTFTYDLNGNTLNDGVNTYTWDARNQLSSISGANSGTFAYDSEGRRILNGGGRALQYDGPNAVQEYNGTTPVAGRITGGVDEFFQRVTTTGTYYPLTDALGSVVALTDSTGAIQTQYTYSPYGSTSPTGTNADNPNQYTGRENDGTGLYYYRARYYNPTTGRFLSEDPIGFAADINRYRYVRGNPLLYRDPSGLINILAGGGVTLAAGTPGAEVSGGVVVNPGLFGQSADAGVFVSPGVTAGVNVSADVFVGYVTGDMSNVSGPTVNQNYGIGPISITIMHNPDTGGVVGATFGLGPGATKAGYSLAYDNTFTYTLRDLLRKPGCSSSH